MEFLTDNAWYIASLLLTGLAIIIPILLDNKKNRKQLSYEIGSNTQLVYQELLKRDIKYVYQGDELQNLSFVLITIANTGNKSLTVHDFDLPIKIFLGDDALIISSELEGCYPKNLPVKFKAEKNEILINPLLLNKNNLFTFKIFVTGVSILKPEITCRLEGIDNVRNLNVDNPYYRYKLAGGLFFFLGIILIGIFNDKIELDNSLTIYNASRWTVIPLLIGLVLGLFGTWKSEKETYFKNFVFSKYKRKSKE